MFWFILPGSGLNDNQRLFFLFKQGSESVGQKISEGKFSRSAAAVIT